MKKIFVKERGSFGAGAMADAGITKITFATCMTSVAVDAGYAP